MTLRAPAFQATGDDGSMAGHVQSGAGRTHELVPASLPARAGIGLKSQHFRAILDTNPDVGFFEIHAENYMVEGGPYHHFLGLIRERYALSLHGVGLSIGGEAPLDLAHLDRLANLIDRYQPAAFSEHLAWSCHGGTYFNDLLPVPYDTDTLTRVCNHIDQTQERLGCRMLLENPSTYLEFTRSTMAEAQFVCEVVRRTGCGLLLDVNNAYVSCVNHGRDAQTYINELPLWAVGEIHLAGFTRDRDANGDPLLIDSHGCAVDEAVWALFGAVAAGLGPLATLLERDNNLPPLATLLDEAHRAESLMRPPAAAGVGAVWRVAS
jgi:uncharacterized protein (UPF0276 family)